MKFSKIASLCPLLLVAFVMSLSCGDSGAPGHGTFCVEDEDCGADERCDAGVCTEVPLPSSTGSGLDSLPESTTTATGTSGNSRPPVTRTDDYQQPCERDADCESGICLRTPDGSFCTRPCAFDDECEGDLDWICARVAEGGRDTVQICFPQADFLCDPCSADTDCGGRFDQCVGLNDGSFCGVSCAGDGICPEGFDCAGFEGEEQCVPSNNYCGECFNLDFSANVEHCGGCGLACLLPGAINA